MSAPLFRIEQIRAFMQAMSGIYDVVRLVDPGECRVIRVVKCFGQDGDKKIKEYRPEDMTEQADGEADRELRCFRVWGREERCMECSSYQASISGRIQEKTELLGDKAYTILSVPLLCIDEKEQEQYYCVELVNAVDMSVTSDVRRELSGMGTDPVKKTDPYESRNLKEEVTAKILSAAGDRSGMGIICFDEKGKCIFANASAFRMFEIQNDTAKLGQFLKEWGPLKAVLNHKPFHPESEEYQALIDKTMLKVDALKKKYPNFAI